MASKTIQVLLPGELSSYIQRMVKGGHYQEASEDTLTIREVSCWVARRGQGVGSEL